MKRVRRLSFVVTGSISLVLLTLLSGASRSTEGAAAPKYSRAPRGQTSTLLPDGRWLFVGGDRGQVPQASAVLWDPVSNTLTPTRQTLQFARAGHTATVLPDGTVFIWGGFGSGGEIVTTAELFSPETQSFTPLFTPSLTPRSFHTATLLTDGQVLITGGRAVSGEILATAELWNPRTLTTEPIPGVMDLAREQHDAFLRADGTVLLRDGKDANEQPLGTDERYLPAQQTFVTQGVTSIPSSSLMVMASMPEGGATDVPLDSLIVVRFSHPVQVTTATTDSVTLASPHGVETVLVTAAEGGRLVFVTPAVSLQPKTVYTLTLDGIIDTTGATLPFTTLAFATGAATSATLSPATNAASSEQQANNSTATVETNGAVIPEPLAQTLNSATQAHGNELPPLQAPHGVTALAGRVVQLNGSPRL